METVKVERIPPGVSGVPEPQSPAARAAARIIEKRGAAPKEESMPKGVKGSKLSDAERKAKKAEYNRAYQARLKAGGKPKVQRAPRSQASVPGSLQGALDELLTERQELDKLIAFLERRIAAK